MSRYRRAFATAVAGFMFSILFAGPWGVTVADEVIPDKVRSELAMLLREKVSSFLKDKNEDGVSYKRGNYSKSFRKVDESTYEGTIHQDTATKDRLKTERYLLTLKKGASGKWAIASQDLKDTYEGLHRGVLGDEEWYRFERFSFDREGMKVTATNGSLFKDFFNGRTSRFVLVASDLAYQYAPPKEMGFFHVHQKILLKKYPEEFVFQPEHIRIECVAPSCDELESSVFTGLRKISATEADPKLQKVYEEGRREFEKNLNENYFAFFRRPATEDRRTYTIAIKRDAQKEYWISLDYDNYEPREVNFFTSGRFFPVFSYNSEEVRKSGIPPHELEGREEQEAKDYELYSLKGTVELALEDVETISGDITYGMTIKRELRELPFFISRIRFQGEEEKDTKNPRMFINSIQDADGNELTWAKLGAFGGLVIFPKPVPAGAKVTLRLQFTNLDSIYKLNPSYSYVDRGGWLPFVRFGDLIDEFDLTTKIPDRYKALGIGRKVSESRKDGVLTTHWTSDSPVSFPTVIFGDYIEDQPSIKATKKDGTEIPVRVYVDKVSTMAGEGGIRGSQLKALGDQAVNALNLYREVYGMDYPFGKLDLVNAPFEPGAQAPASIIYLGSFLFRGEGTLASFTGGSATNAAKFLKDTVAHEVGHQWWGSLICFANFRNYWFEESLAEYSSALFVENVYGKKKYLEKVAEWREYLMDKEVLTSVQDAPVMWGGRNPRGNATIANIYNKGPYAFHVLRETFGDEKFFAFLKTLAADLSGKEIVTRDIQQAAEKSFGGNMEWFFDQWIRGTGIPQYALFYKVRKTEDGKYLVEGKIKQRVTVGLDKTELPGVYYRGLGKLTFILQNGKEFTSPKPILVEGPETAFALKLAEEPLEVHFNKHGELLAHDVLVNRSW